MTLINNTSVLENKSYLCYWKQDRFNRGFVVLNWKDDSWYYPGIYSHVATNFVKQIFNLPEII